jgi:hypothetical protein
LTGAEDPGLAAARGTDADDNDDGTDFILLNDAAVGLLSLCALSLVNPAGFFFGISDTASWLRARARDAAVGANRLLFPPAPPVLLLVAATEGVLGLEEPVDFTPGVLGRDPDTPATEGVFGRAEADAPAMRADRAGVGGTLGVFAAFAAAAAARAAAEGL